MKRSSKSSRRPKPRKFKRPTLQRLESRKLMAGDIGLTDSVLSIQGTDADEIAEVYVDGDRLHVKVSSMDSAGQELCSYEQEYATDDVGRIVFSGGEGNDLFVNDSEIPAIARGGAGNDTLLGGGGNDLLIGGIGDDFIHGGGGDDVSLSGPTVQTAPTPTDSGDAETDDASVDMADDSSPSNEESAETVDPALPSDEPSADASDASTDDVVQTDVDLPVAEADASENDVMCLDEESDPANEEDDNPDDEPEPLAPAADQTSTDVEADANPSAEPADDVDPVASESDETLESTDVMDAVDGETDAVDAEDSFDDAESTSNEDVGEVEVLAVEPTHQETEVTVDAEFAPDTEPSDESEPTGDTEPGVELDTTVDLESTDTEDEMDTVNGDEEASGDDLEADPQPMDPEPPVNLDPQPVEMSEDPIDEPISDPVPTEEMSETSMDADDNCEPLGAEPLNVTQQPETTDAIDDIFEEGVLETEPIELAVESDVDDSQVEPEATADASEDRDVIFGGSGNDWLMGDGGDDVIFGNLSPIEDQLLREVIADLLRA